MMRSPIVVGIAAFVAGSAVTAGAFTAFPSHAPRTPSKEPSKEPVDEGGLAKANQNLTESLQACDRKLDELKNASPQPVAIASAAPPERDGGRGGRRGQRGEPTAEDWDRMAQLGTVRVRVPCVRDTPW